MNDCPGRGPGPRPHRLRRARAAAASTAVASLTLLAAACGTGPGGSPNAGGPANSASTTAQKALAYSRCMRSHGVPGYPDPNSSGQLPKITPANESQLGVSDSRFTAAQAACQHLWPYNVNLSQAQQRQLLTDGLRFAQCMRSHGLPNVPDPVIANGHIEFDISISRDGFDPHSPQVIANARECVHLLPGGTLPYVDVSP